MSKLKMNAVFVLPALDMLLSFYFFKLLLIIFDCSITNVFVSFCRSNSASKSLKSQGTSKDYRRLFSRNTDTSALASSAPKSLQPNGAGVFHFINSR